MKERKYKSDWHLESGTDGKGKDRLRPVYHGPVYQGEGGRSLLLRAAVPWAAWLALELLYLILDFPGARTLYVFLPFALELFPGLYWLLGILALARAPEKMTRLQKENGVGRILRSSAGCAVFGTAALIGDLVLLTAGGRFEQEWPGTLMIAASAAASYLTIRTFRALNRKLDSGKGASR